MHAIDSPKLSGPLNIVAGATPQVGGGPHNRGVTTPNRTDPPGPTPQREFASALASALWKPGFLPAPAFAGSFAAFPFHCLPLTFHCLSTVFHLPAFAVRTLLGGEMAQALVLASHRVGGAALAADGFVWEVRSTALPKKRGDGRRNLIEEERREPRASFLTLHCLLANFLSLFLFPRPFTGLWSTQDADLRELLVKLYAWGR